MLYSILKKKKDGYILLMVMLFIASLSLLVVSFSLKIYVARNSTKTIVERHMMQKDIATAVACVQATLSGECTEKGDAESINKKESSAEGKTEEESKNKTEKNTIMIFNRIYPILYQWHIFKEKNSTRKISFYLSSENGKIPLEVIWKKIDEIYTKKTEQHNKMSNNNDANTDNNTTNKLESDNENNDEKKKKNEEKEKEVNENIWIKKAIKWLKKFDGKKSFLKEGENNEDDDKNIDSNEKMIHPLVEKLKKIYTTSNEQPYNLFFLNKKEKNLNTYNFSKKNVLTNEEKNNKENDTEKHIGAFSDYYSAYNKKCSIWYATPELLESLGFKTLHENKEKIGIYQKHVEKMIKNGLDKRKIIDILSLFSPQDENNKFKKDLIDEEIINEFFTAECDPGNVTAIILLEEEQSKEQSSQKNDTLPVKVVVIFEKIGPFEDDNISYAIKQLYIM